MRRFGLIGYPLSHSFSKKFFTEKFEKAQISDCVYELFPIEHIGMLSELITRYPDLEGINVTIPHKLAVMPLLNELDKAAAEIGAVNCVAIINKDDSRYLKGHNTDAYGFEASLTPLLKGHHTKALVFGDGGAAKAVKYVLNKLNISFTVVSRKTSPENISYQHVTAQLLTECTLLINTTPLGMSPQTDTYPELPYEALGDRHLAYDLVYNPEETAFLSKAKAAGATVKNGLEMLHLQAERSWQIWNL